MLDIELHKIYGLYNIGIDIADIVDIANRIFSVHSGYLKPW